jgi:vitamin B12 transporter
MEQHKLLAALLCAVSTIVSAQDSLDEVVVTATRSNQMLGQTLSHSSIITRQQIDDSQVPDLPTLLRDLAGIEIYQSGGVGKQSSLFLRGSNSSHTLVLLDGVRINSATAGTTQVDQLMLDQIERIEVVRGNVSSLYGSDAIGGVIQIFTRKGKGAPVASGSLGAGSQNTLRAAAGFGGQVGDTTYHLRASGFRTDGGSAVSATLVPTVNPDRDSYDNTSLSLDLRHAFSDAHSMEASLFDSVGHNQTDNAFGAATDQNSSQSDLQKLVLISEDRLGDDWLSKLQLSRGVDDTQNFLNGAPDLWLGARFKTTSDLFSWQNSLHLGEGQQLLVGVERLMQQVTSSTLYTRTRRTDDSLYAGYTGRYGLQQVQLNLRRDRYSDAGSVDTWLLGYGLDVTDDWRITASMATAFKAPTLNDLFYPYVDFGFGYSYVGNPGLKPERSRDSELGLHYATEGQRLDMVYFDNRISDLIAINTLPASTMINLNQARSNGLEFAYLGQFGDTAVRLAATWQNPHDTLTGDVLLRRARHFSSVGVTRQVGALKLGGEWRHSGERTDVDINTFARTALAPYDVINLTANYAFDRALSLSARVDNLFDQRYMLAHGYNPPGRVIYVGLNYQP